MNKNAASSVSRTYGAKKGIKKWWPDPESNWGHRDFQSLALPTELSCHLVCLIIDTVSGGLSSRPGEKNAFSPPISPLTSDPGFPCPRFGSGKNFPPHLPAPIFHKCNARAFLIREIKSKNGAFSRDVRLKKRWGRDIIRHYQFTTGVMI